MENTISEKRIENFIKNFPDEFLGEKLSLIAQQLNLYGFRPDLVFRDQYGQYVVVEIQLGSLDRNHLYRVLEYRDMLKVKKRVSTVRTILVCEEIEERYERLLEIHQIEHVKIDISVFLKKAKSLETGLKIEIKGQIEKNKNKSVYAKDILKTLSKNRFQNENVKIEATVFWTRSSDTRDEDFLWLNATNLNDITNIEEDFFYYDSLPYITNDEGYTDYVYVPIETIVSSNILELGGELWMLENWISLLDHFCYKEKTDVEIVLGCRGYFDIFGYEEYVTGIIKKFNPHWRRYDTISDGYCRDKIKEDLECLKNIILYTGKYNNLEETKLFCDYEIIDGPGHLEKNWLFFEKRVQGMWEPEEIEERYSRYNKKDWCTIKLKEVNPIFLKAMKKMVHHLIFSHDKIRNEDRFLCQCHMCLIPPANLKNLNEEALKLSSKYFLHYK